MRRKIVPAKLRLVWLLGGVLLALTMLVILGVVLGGHALTQEDLTVSITPTDVGRNDDEVGEEALGHGEVHVAEPVTLTEEAGDEALGQGEVHVAESVTPTEEAGDEAVGHGEVHVAEPVTPTAPAVWVKDVASGSDTATVMVNDTFTVEVMKNTTQTLGAFNFYLVWDDSRLEFIDAQPGGNVSGTFMPLVPSSDTLHIVAFTLSPPAVPAGAEALAVVQFRATAVGTSALNVIDAAEAAANPEYEAVSLADAGFNPLPDLEVTDGSVLVMGSSWAHQIFVPIIVRNHTP